MVKEYHWKYRQIPASRIASFDVYATGMRKHHVSALLEFDVTDSRENIKQLRKKGKTVSFNAYLIKAISKSLQAYPEASGYLSGKRRLLTYRDINVSMVVEKQLEDQKVPIPMVLKKTNEKSAESITQEIEEAKSQILSKDDIVLGKKTKFYEKLYYRLPGFLRRMVWRYMLAHPRSAYKTMGNVSITSVGMMGQINGWFIHKSVHPISFGIGSIIKKPVVRNDEIIIREILNMTILIDHDVIDGAPMVRFVKELTKNIEEGNES